jgi:hypothetical protein
MFQENDRGNEVGNKFLSKLLEAWLKPTIMQSPITSHDDISNQQLQYIIDHTLRNRDFKSEDSLYP